MRKHLRPIIATLAATLAGWQGAAAQDVGPMIMVPGGAAVAWQAGPPNLPKGSQIAVLAGDPGKSGPFVLRVKFPPNTVVAPHRHVTAENLTVLSGADLIKQVSKHLHSSIIYSLDNREDAMAYAMQFARDMQPELADRFVAMWVNALTLDYGDRGRESVKRLLAEGHKAGIIPHKVKVDFVD